jgi:hypothetical protein
MLQALVHYLKKRARIVTRSFPNFVVVILRKVGFYTKPPSISPVMAGIQGITHVTRSAIGEDVSC